jgi:hypothetical protein
MYFSPPMLIRILTPFAVLCAFAGCGKIADGRLFGLWRSEIGEDPYTEIDELRLNPDHTFFSWMCPAELTTPQTFVYGGEWHVRGNHIEMDSRLLNKEALPEHRSFQVLPSKDDELLVKNMDDGKTFRFHRFNLPRCTTSSAQSDPVEIDRNIVGSWDVHYHTHDFKYRLAPDHTVNVLGKLSQSDKYFPLWKGTWDASGPSLSMDLKSDARGSQDKKVHWILYRFQHDCFFIKDPDGVEYAVHRAD